MIGFPSVPADSDFNPRSHEGSDTSMPWTACRNFLFQSTLPRGERQQAHGNRKSHLYFNPRSHEGSDCSRYSVTTLTSLFQSTLPRGERPKSKRSNTSDKLFQSTLPRGERQLVNVIKEYGYVISIHAPTRGATTSLFIHLFLHCISIHAPTRGATAKVHKNYPFFTLCFY